MEKFKTMDGNEAAAYVSYAFTEVATIYPITPSSPMAEHVDRWSAQGRKNLFGQPVRLMEMQSEHGAAGAMHGALEAGALAASYTASQGLLLMVPAMYRLAGQLHPAVLHVSARTVGAHAFSIFGDHSDVMACRQAGFGMLASGSVQEVMDLAGVAHLAAIEGRVPFLHFFDGFRTSHEVQKIETLSYEDLGALLNEEALEAFRKRSLNPERPVQRSTVQNPDIFFQNREAANLYYDRLPGLVEQYLQHISQLTGRQYQLFNYYGAPDADRVVVAMGSVCETLRETVDYLNRDGGKTGLVQVHLYRPFSVRHLLNSLPSTIRCLTVLDRTKEPGAAGEPLYQDVCSALIDQAVKPVILAGRFGLSSKDVPPEQMAAVYENMAAPSPQNHFTVGIDDDVTHLSLPVGPKIETGDPETISCKFWGLASDGTVGANKNSIKIIGDNTSLYAQAYFEYDTKKSGGVTKSHLRFGPRPIRSAYLIKQADFAACHNASYLHKYDIVSEIRPGGSLLINCAWERAELEEKLPQEVKLTIAEQALRLYTIDASKIARELGLGSRINTILQAAFFKLTGILPLEEAVGRMKKAIRDSYGHKGEKILNMNYAAVDRGVSDVLAIEVPEAWKMPSASEEAAVPDENLPDYVRNILRPVNALKGDDLPVSAFLDMADGTVPLGTSKFEKRGIASEVPVWIAENCLQCNQCSFVCPHAAIRPYLLNNKEFVYAPESYKTVEAKGKDFSRLYFRIQVSPLDCNGCGSCVQVCPSKNPALTMLPMESQVAEAENWRFSQTLSIKPNPLDKYSVKGSQFEPPLLEFSGACAGCGETPYMKLLTQLFGGRMYVANATGCTQAWGAASPCVPYEVNSQGHGPAWSNSLFENNAEFSLGMALAVDQQRARLLSRVEILLKNNAGRDKILDKALNDWRNGFKSSEDSRELTDALVGALSAGPLADSSETRFILANREHLTKKSMWMYGGDGWAYDIGYGGLDHVMAGGADLNILVVDTEVYSNTGGQSSKATPLGSVAQFAAGGKRTPKKDLGLMAMSYGHVYVAQVAMGAGQSQLIKALKEAESYPGPSLVIAYAPCINHGIIKGMAYAQEESKLAVESGYWHLYRFDPRRKEAGLNPFQLDSKAPHKPLAEFLKGEIRYASLERTFPQTAKELLSQAEILAQEKYEHYQRLAESDRATNPQYGLKPVEDQFINRQ